MVYPINTPVRAIYPAVYLQYPPYELRPLGPHLFRSLDLAKLLGGSIPYLRKRPLRFSGCRLGRREGSLFRLAGLGRMCL